MTEWRGDTPVSERGRQAGTAGAVGGVGRESTGHWRGGAAEVWRPVWSRPGNPRRQWVSFPGQRNCSDGAGRHPNGNLDSLAGRSGDGIQTSGISPRNCGRTEWENHAMAMKNDRSPATRMRGAKSKLAAFGILFLCVAWPFFAKAKDRIWQAWRGRCGRIRHRNNQCE